MTAVFTVAPVANAGGPTPIAYTTTPPFTQQSDIGYIPVTGPITFAPNTVGATRNATVYATLKADGTNIPTFTGIVAHSSDAGYVNTSGILNTLVMFFDGLRYYYSWSQDAALTPYTPPAFSIAGSAPAGTVSTAYTTTYTASGGVSPYTYSVFSGTLPAGLTLNAATGVLSGTPTANATYTFVIRATDSTGGTPQTVNSSTQSVVISAAGAATISGAAPAGTVGTAYTYTFTTTGFVGAITATVGSGTLPAGLALSVSGTNIILSGTPTTAATSTFVVHGVGATSGTADSASQSVTVTASSGAQIVRFSYSPTPANFVESGDGTVGYSYTSANGNAFTTSGVAELLSMAGDGWLGATVSDVASGDAGMIGLSTAIDGSNYASWIVSLVQNGGATYRVFVGGTEQTITAVAPVVGNKYRLRRAGTSIIAESSADNFSTVTTLYTLTGATTASLKLHGSAAQTGVVSNVRGFGLA